MLDKIKNTSCTVREDEPDYAFIPETAAPEKNRYGKAIQLVDRNHRLAGESLNINGDTSIGDNPNRYKQHGFYFNADNCIACHACESACSEKNDLPPHLAFRSVGYLEGGSYPDYRRLNISMACNHCDDPVCLKGCPTRAYTKFAEYGAVLQDPNICFGCGYCTWVCPYNAPQLDPVKGQVEKCNMCVDRLEAGLKPACATACLAGALDFGVIETKPANRDQLAVSLPGFPDPEVTHPNIRFQQTRSLPVELNRPDNMPLCYERDNRGNGGFKVTAKKINKERQWNWRRLSSRENPLVAFTLLTQAVIGAFVILFFGDLVGMADLNAHTHTLARWMLLSVLVGLQGFALLMSTVHLGKPLRFYRGFNNLRYSPVSREAAALMGFFGFLGIYTLIIITSDLLGLPGSTQSILPAIAGWGAFIAGPVTIYFMHRIYRIKARPFWNHWQVLTAFYGNMLSLGAVIVGVFYSVSIVIQGLPYAGLMQALAWPIITGLVLEAVGLIFHVRAMRRMEGEGAASHHEQRTAFGNTYLARNISLGLSIALVLVLVAIKVDGLWGLAAWTATGLLILATAFVGRALFYVLVIPTTMPGAFFWRNRGFQEHARQTGLADLPQVGVALDTH